MKTKVKNLPSLFPELSLSDYQIIAPADKPAPAVMPVEPARVAPSSPSGAVNHTHGWRLADVAGFTFLAIFYCYLILHL